MLDINYKNIVEDAIKKNIKYYEPFTSLDISNQCKQINPYLRHKDVSQFVHEYMNKCFENNTTNYISTTINVNNNLNRTTLYHPKWESNLFLAYDEDRRNLKPIPTKRDPLSIPIVHSLILKEIDRFGLIFLLVRLLHRYRFLRSLPRERYLFFDKQLILPYAGNPGRLKIHFFLRALI